MLGGLHFQSGKAQGCQLALAAVCLIPPSGQGIGISLQDRGSHVFIIGYFLPSPLSQVECFCSEEFLTSWYLLSPSAVVVPEGSCGKC